MSKVNAILVDDSAQARKLLRLMLAELAPNAHVCAEATNVNDAIAAIEQHKPHVVFLDIEMPGRSGLQLAEWLIAEEINCQVIFTTAYNEYALKAFRLSAIDYLLKPIDEQQLTDAVNKVNVRISADEAVHQLKAMLKNIADKDNAHTISIPTLNGYLFLNTDDIIYIKADGAYTHIHVKDKAPITVSKNLKYFENTLQDIPYLIRVHRSYLVNIKQVNRYDKSDRGSLIMNDDTVIDVARERRDVLFVALGI